MTVLDCGRYKVRFKHLFWNVEKKLNVEVKDANPYPTLLIDKSCGVDREIENIKSPLAHLLAVL